MTMTSPYLERPVRTLSEAVADMARTSQEAADGRLLLGAVTFAIARFRDLRHAARTPAQIAAFNREISALENWIARTRRDP
jgi:hypothetical protein